MSALARFASNPVSADASRARVVSGRHRAIGLNAAVVSVANAPDADLQDSRLDLIRAADYALRFGHSIPPFRAPHPVIPRTNHL